MRQGPRDSSSRLFTRQELLISILQGVIIAFGALSLYYFYMTNGASLEQTRTIVFTTLILSNVFLTFSNRSFTQTIYYTSRYKNNLALLLLFISAIFLAALHLAPAVRNLFELSVISINQFWLCVVVAFISVMWFEVYKAFFLPASNESKLALPV